MKNLLLSLSSLFFGCFLAASIPAQEFDLSSPGFSDGKGMPDKFCTKKVGGGKNFSPALSWKNIPEGAKSFVISCIDKHPFAKDWVHWMVINIPSKITQLPEDASLKKMPKGCIELNNSFGYAGYGGPQPPPKTGVHKYIFTIYALNVEKLSLPKNSLSEKELEKLLAGKVIGKAELIGTYSR